MYKTRPTSMIGSQFRPALGRKWAKNSKNRTNFILHLKLNDKKGLFDQMAT